MSTEIGDTSTWTFDASRFLAQSTEKDAQGIFMLNVGRRRMEESGQSEL